MILFYEQENLDNCDIDPHVMIEKIDIQELNINKIHWSSTSQSLREKSSYRLNEQHNDGSSIIILDEDDDDDNDAEIQIDSTITMLDTNKDSASSINHLIGKLDIDTEMIHVQSSSTFSICTAALAYSKLTNTHLILVNSRIMSKPQCILKRKLYLSQTHSSTDIPRRTRVYNRFLSLLGFILETPCSEKNRDRYLIAYDNFSAGYHFSTDFHLCLCQDFSQHMSNLDSDDIQVHYQHAFRRIHQNVENKFSIGQTIPVRKYGVQYHNARVIDQDCALIKICFFERKSQPEMWIHCQSSIIQSGFLSLMSQPLISSTFPVNNSTVNNSAIHSDASCSHKRSRHLNNENEGRKRLRDRSNIKRIQFKESSSSSLSSCSSSSSDETSLSSRANMLNAYYTTILLPKFRVLNSIPYSAHKCSNLCVFSTEEKYYPDRIDINPFLIPFQCRWSIVDGKPRGYRTPCRRVLYSSEDIERYLYKTESKLSIKYFVDDLLTRFMPLIKEEYDRNYVMMNDLSNGCERVQVPVYNDIDNELPDLFTYITEIRPFDRQIEAALNDTNMTSCCDCTDNCSNRMKCACFRKTLDQAIYNRDPLIIEKQRNRYTMSHILKTMAYQRKRLLNPVSSGIYECNSNCSCHRQHCTNRLTQQGVFVQLQLFKDKQKGWGLRTLHDLPRGTFICEYIGEMLTSDQGHERAQTMDDKYQTSLDLIKQIRYATDDDDDEDDDNDDDNDEEPYVIDGSLFSNLGKYFNHSCDPNMYIQNVFIESHDLHFPHLAIFTSSHVKAGQELTWHYNCELLPDRQVTCHCGSKNCRGRLF